MKILTTTLRVFTILSMSLFIPQHINADLLSSLGGAIGIGTPTKPGVLNQIITQKPSNAELVLAAIGFNFGSLFSQTTFTDSVPSLQAFLGWLTPLVSSNPTAASAFTSQPYFNYTNVQELKILMTTLQAYMSVQLANSGQLPVANQMTFNQMFVNLQTAINTTAPVGFANIAPTVPSMAQRGIFNLTIVGYKKNFALAWTGLTTATNARNVLNTVSNLYARLCSSTSTLTTATRLDFQRFRYATDPTTIAYLASNNTSLQSSISSFLTKLATNVKTTQNTYFAGLSPIAYFDTTNFTTLKNMLLVLQHFFTEKMCADRAQTAALFQQFFAKYPQS